MFSPKRFLFFLILGAAALTLYFCLRLTSALFPYFLLKEQAEAKISQWEIEEIKGKYAIEAAYTFEVQGKIWKGKTTLSGPLYLNEEAAISALKQRAKNPWKKAWYSPQNPSTSTLEKLFPTSLFLRTIICFGIFIYFCLFNKKNQIIF